MHTDLPEGAPFVTRDKGRWVIWEVKQATTERHPGWGRGTYGVLSRPLEAGDVVYRCVWATANRLEARKRYTLQPGDVTWEDSGLIGIPQGIAPGQPIYRNRFAGRCPAWLRSVE